MPNYLDEYLIGLGFEVNIPDLRKFESIVGQARNLVTSETSEMAKQLLKWQVAITGGFTAIATATLGVADKVAMADQSYRLFSERMYMTESAGRSLKRALDALGTTIEEASYDPELNARVQQLVADDRKAQEGLGESLKGNLKRIRDVQAELIGLGQAGEDVIFGLVSELSQHFAPQIDAARAQIKKWKDEILNNLPEISDWLEQHALPIFREMWVVLSDTKELLKELGKDFVNIVGILNGDDALEHSQLTFESMAKAIEEATHDLAQFVRWMIRAEQVAGSLAKGGLHFAKSFYDGLMGDFEGEDKEWQKTKEYLKQGSKAVPYGSETLGAITGSYNEVVKGFGFGDPVMDSLAVRLARGLQKGWTAGYNPNARSLPPNSGNISDSLFKDTFTSLRSLGLSQYSEAIQKASAATGIPVELLKAIITEESGGRNLPPKKLKNGLDVAGVMQLEGPTAADMGVKDRMNPTDSIMGGAKYMQLMMNRYGGDIYKALEAYNWGMKGVDKYGGSHLPDETQKYVGDIMKMWVKEAGVSDQNFNITITVNGVTGGEEVARLIKQQFIQIQQQINQRNAAALPMSY